MASDKGEFLARVVKFRETISRRENFITLPARCATKNNTTKKISSGTNIRTSSMGFSIRLLPSDANITTTARHRNSSCKSSPWSDKKLLKFSLFLVNSFVI